MYCGEHSVVNESGAGGTAVSLRCKCWHCDTCAPINRWKVVFRCLGGAPERLLTLTCDPRRHETPDDAARALVGAWRTLRRRIAKRYDCDPPPFIAVFEATKKGWPHMHLLLRGERIDQRWLSRQMAELIGAPIVDIRKVKATKNAARYVSKYLGKDLHRFAGTKRFWTSQDWTVDKSDDPEPKELFGDCWTKHSMTLDEIENRVLALGWAVERTPRRLDFWAHPP